MDRMPVSSSNLAEVGYDPQTQTLEIMFLTGAVYQYIGVPEAHHLGLLSASSKGTYLDQHIKKAGYPYARIA